MKGVYIVLFFLLVGGSYCCNHQNKYLPIDDLEYRGELRKAKGKSKLSDTANIKEWIKKAELMCLGDPDTAEIILEHIMEQCTSIRYYSGLGRALIALGVAQYNRKQYQESKQSLFKALTYYQKVILDDREEIVPIIFMNIGSVFVRLQCTDSAFYYYHQSLALADAAENPGVLKVCIYNGIVGCLIMAKRYIDAQYFLDKSMKLALSLNDNKSLAFCYSVMASLQEEKNIDSAMYYHQKSLALYRILKRKVHIEQVLYSIGQMWILKSQPDSAEYYINLSEQVLPYELRSPMSGFVDRGNIHRLRGDYESALYEYKLAERVLKPSEFAEEGLVVYACLSRVYHQLNENALAYQYQALQYRLKDSVFNEGKQAAIDQLITKFRMIDKDKDLLSKQLLISQQDGEIQTQYMGISLLVIMMLSLIFILYQRRSRAALVGINAKLAGAEQERLRLAQEIHDGIVSQLTSVKMNFNALPEYEKEFSVKLFQETLGCLDASIAQLRQTTHNLHPALLRHIGLRNAITNFVVQINAGGQIKVKVAFVGVFPLLSDLADLHLYRIIQDLVQNLWKLTAGEELALQIVCDETRLGIMISDDGKEIDLEAIINNSNLGFDNMRERIKLLKGLIDIQRVRNRTLLNLQFSLKSLIEYV